MERNYSENMARNFEIIGFSLLIPAIFGLWAATEASGIYRDSTLFVWVIWSIFLAGVILLVGYFKHSRDELSLNLVPVLWIGTAIYNALLMVPALSLLIMWILLLFSDDFPEKHNNDPFQMMIYFSVVGIIIVVYAMLVFKALKALRFYRREC